VVNRRGLGIHLTFERFASGFTPETVERRGTVYQEALAAATKPPLGGAPTKAKSKSKNSKVLIFAILSLIQGLVVVVNEVFDVIGALHFT